MMIFKFKNLLDYCVRIIVLTILVLIVSLVAFLHGNEIKHVVLILMIFLPIFGLSLFMIIQNFMDLVINDFGVERKFFGRTWQKLLWKDISLIKVFEIFSYADYSKVRSFNIFGSDRKIFFSERMSDKVKFLELFNYYIYIYKIKVEIVIDGVAVRTDKVPYLK